MGQRAEMRARARSLRSQMRKLGPMIQGLSGLKKDEVRETKLPLQPRLPSRFSVCDGQREGQNQNGICPQATTSRGTSVVSQLQYERDAGMAPAGLLACSP